MTATRGTTNRNARGSSEARRRRREWLVATFRADVDAPAWVPGIGLPRETAIGFGRPACRCYRCGRLLTVDTVSPDRIVPGAEGGTYRRNNIRPACSDCQSITGAQLGHARRKAKRTKPIRVLTPAERAACTCAGPIFGGSTADPSCPTHGRKGVA